MNRTIKLFNCDCGFETENSKSWSNHTRFGCKSTKFIEEKCLCCGNNLPKRKPSKKGLYCNQKCYMVYRK